MRLAVLLACALRQRGIDDGAENTLPGDEPDLSDPTAQDGQVAPVSSGEEPNDDGKAEDIPSTQNVEEQLEEGEQDAQEDALDATDDTVVEAETGADDASVQQANREEDINSDLPDPHDTDAPSAGGGGDGTEVDGGGFLEKYSSEGGPDGMKSANTDDMDGDADGQKPGEKDEYASDESGRKDNTDGSDDPENENVESMRDDDQGENVLDNGLEEEGERQEPGEGYEDADSLLEVPRKRAFVAPHARSSKAFDRKFANAEKRIHAELAAMAPKASSLLETGDGAAAKAIDLDDSESAADMWKEIQAKAKTESWAEVGAHMAQTKNAAIELEQEIPQPRPFAPGLATSFAQLGQKTSASDEAQALLLRQKLERKVKADQAAADSAIDAFASETGLELDALQSRLPGETIADTLAKARKHASLLQTGGRSEGVTADLLGQLDHLEALSKANVDHQLSLRRH